MLKIRFLKRYERTIDLRGKLKVKDIVNETTQYNSMYDLICDIFADNKSGWNYYEEEFINPFLDAEDIENFIKKFFFSGGKARAIINLLPEIKDMRYYHLISVFFLGIIVQQKSFPNLEILSTNLGNYPFAYLWYIVCLFHDIGYKQEENWRYKVKYKRDNLKFFREHMDIIPSLKSYNKSFLKDDLGVLFYPDEKHFCCSNREKQEDKIRFNNGAIYKQPRYCSVTIARYLCYCIENDNIKHYDHGIVGGYWLYDGLMKNYIEKFKMVKKNNFDTRLELFYDEMGLQFSTEQWKIFSYLADCIISHNMWISNEETEDLYKKYGLYELQMSHFNKISFKENPILYTLVVCDTIDPIKVFYTKEIDVQSILKGVNLYVDSTTIILEVKDVRLDYNLIKKKTEGIDTWVDCSIDYDLDDKKICIKLVI